MRSLALGRKSKHTEQEVNMENGQNKDKPKMTEQEAQGVKEIKDMNQGMCF